MDEFLIEWKVLHDGNQHMTELYQRCFVSHFWSLDNEGIVRIGEPINIQEMKIHLVTEHPLGFFRMALQWKISLMASYSHGLIPSKTCYT